MSGGALSMFVCGALFVCSIWATIERDFGWAVVVLVIGLFNGALALDRLGVLTW